MIRTLTRRDCNHYNSSQQQQIIQSDIFVNNPMNNLINVKDQQTKSSVEDQDESSSVTTPWSLIEILSEISGIMLTRLTVESAVGRVQSAVEGVVICCVEMYPRSWGEQAGTG